MKGITEEKNRILILGASGFIGTNLTLRLLSEQKRLTLFDRPGALYPDDACGFMRGILPGQICRRRLQRRKRSII